MRALVVVPMHIGSYLPSPSLRTLAPCAAERAVQVDRRLDALVEDPDLRAVADADDVAVDGDQVAGAQLADVLLGRREGQLVLGHLRTPVESTGRRRDEWAHARRAAQHW